MYCVLFGTAWVRSPTGGGWLKKLSESHRGNPNRPEGSSDYRSNDVTKLMSKLIGVLEYKSELQTFLRNSNKNYESKVLLLPVKARLCILRHPGYPSVQSHGQTTYFELLKHPIDPMQRAMRDDATLALDSMEYFFICLLRYPSVNQEGSGILSSGGEVHLQFLRYMQWKLLVLCNDV